MLEFTEITDTNDRNDVMGDIVDPFELELDDFYSEWVWRDHDLGKIPWFFKPEKADQGFGFNRISGDVNETLLATQARLEPILIDICGADFVKRINKLASTGIVGCQDEVVWFVNNDDEKVYIREEVKLVLDEILPLFVQNISVNKLIKGNDKALSATKNIIELFTNNKRSDIKEFSRYLITKAAESKSDKPDPESIVEAAKLYLQVPMLSKIVYTYCINIYWCTYKYQFNVQGTIANWKNYLTSLSIQKQLESEKEYDGN